MNLNPSQTKAWEYLTESETNLFLTGEAGSGKSFLIHRFISKKNKKEFPVLASTGAAAVLVGGRTFHSFLGLGILKGGFEPTLQKALKDRQVVKRLKSAKGLIIDEVSMLSGLTLKTAEAICRFAREIEEPWGGLRIIAVGDFAQLPPIAERGQRRPWAFHDPIWRKTNFETLILNQNMRTQNSDFLKVLNSVRSGDVTDEVTDFLNQRVIEQNDDYDGTRLFPRRDQTDRYNFYRLKNLEGEVFSSRTLYWGKPQSVEQLKKHSPIGEEVHLKLGALVMIRQNDPRLRWVNGSTGWIKSLSEEVISIELISNQKTIELEKTSFSLFDANGKESATATNFPLSLAWGATIHKSQGMSLDRLVVQLKNLWEPGQAYVALSRARDPEQLWIEDWEPSSIRVDPEVVRFHNELSGQ